MTFIPAAQELLARARALTRLEDCGDPRFMIALDQLVRSINVEATPTPEGAAAAVARLLRLLINRLRFQADLAQHPEILTEKLLPPIVVCGLPRVGSTKVHRLLAESGDFQGLIFWQGFNPARVPMNSREQTDPRIAEAVRFLEWRSRLSPASNAAHYMAAGEPEEDTYLLEYTLHTYWPTTYFEVPGFLRWLQVQDRDHAFLYVRQLLQYLQWQFHRESPRPWVLKSPINFGYEDLLARHLPGAKFVVLHRDPADVLASTVGIVRELRRLYCGAPADQKKAGAWAIAEYSGAMRRHLAWRAHALSSSVLDVPYRDIRHDHMSVMAQIYDFYGVPMSAGATQRMRDWAAVNSQHKHGVHRYSLHEAGLTREQVREEFGQYVKKFGKYLSE